MKISVFTPLSANGNPYIEAAFETLLSQTHGDWEWVVLENHGGKLPASIRKHERVRCYGDKDLEGIGALKRRCCELSEGEILFELDHDDLLHDTALEKAHAALKDADFCVSDFAEFVDGQFVEQGSEPPRWVPFADGAWLPNTYRADCGWTNYPVTFQGHDLLAQPNPEITPQNIRRVEWSPNHLRAWRKDAYWRMGGHNVEYPVIDDHELIVRGYLMGMRYAHIHECLYFYRVHGSQTVKRENALIQRLTAQVYDLYVFPLAEKFARDNALSLIDLCGGHDCPTGYVPLDKTFGQDLNEPWPLLDNSVGVLRASDAIEHLEDPIHIMNEAYRVLAPGGFLLISVPSTDGRGAFQDPTHVTFWNENSFWYYTRSSHSRYIPDFKGRFQIASLKTFYPNAFCEEHKLSYVQAHLIALKDGYNPMGEVMI